MSSVYSNKKQIVNSVFMLILLAILLIHDAKALSDSSHAKLDNPKAIILIHGLMRTPASMFFLRSYLKKQGYQVYSYDYPSAKNTIHEHGVFLTQYLKKFIHEHPNTKIYLITHSLGGIIARDALAQLPTDQLQLIGGLIMLAPPNQGSLLAKFSTKYFPMISYFVKPLTELSSEKNSYVHQVPVPNVKIGIIAGRYDAKVPPASARLDGQAEPVIVNSTHTFIMNNSQARLFIKRFLETGSFN
ncbi:alpha/beta fold hydrolase [Legionella sp. km772]|uniref:alpha/beta fold hydrolase n=1 Tax=Legionella sp. km772 TaxID=2498111 RepID=UPI000F8D7E56|nr:alpha/beta fold hydrolase [Legionella sp. km772]RUR06456.1 alpha/beta fold hydrolase [Legionella sp. km772]